MSEPSLADVVHEAVERAKADDKGRDTSRDSGCPPHEDLPDPNNPDECLVCQDYWSELDRADKSDNWFDSPRVANAVIRERWPGPISRLTENPR